ncbi:MAG: cache domain-containing protein [Patescibacteria group bacterium]|nr:cache domain-containing protein [Patescibacteria group bacterium]MDE1946100.1 cache domain-containing protein [Patescibacteria group bacterium]
MTAYFLVNNLSFAVGMISAIMLLMAAWLSFDAYRLGREHAVLLRTIGLSLEAVWNIFYILGGTSDILLYIGLIFFFAGLIILAASFLEKKDLVANAVIVIPAFSAVAGRFFIAGAAVLFFIAYLSYRQAKREYNRTWLPFSAACFLFGIAVLFAAFGGSMLGAPSLISLAGELAASVALGTWIWQFMRLRLSESFVMIAVGTTFILATVITLAFSTILSARVSTDTSANLLTNVKVMNLSIGAWEQESLAKAGLIAADGSLARAVAKSDMVSLDQIAERYLGSYNLGFLTVTDAGGTVLVRAHALSRLGDSLADDHAFEEAANGNSIATIAESPVEGFSIRAGASVRDGSGRIIGTVIAGFPLDNVFADRLHALTGLDMFVYDGTTSVASTLFDTDGVTRLVGTPVDPNIAATVFSGAPWSGPTDIFGKPFYASFLPLANADGKIVGMISSAESEQDIVDIANAANRLTLITVTLIMLVMLMPILLISKKLET